MSLCPTAAPASQAFGQECMFSPNSMPSIGFRKHDSESTANSHYGGSDQKTKAESRAAGCGAMPGLHSRRHVQRSDLSGERDAHGTSPVMESKQERLGPTEALFKAIGPVILRSHSWRSMAPGGAKAMRAFHGFSVANSRNLHAKSRYQKTLRRRFG